MKKSFKSVLMIVLAVVMLLSVSIPAFAFFMRPANNKNTTTAKAGITESVYYEVSNLSTKEKNAVQKQAVGTVIVMGPKSGQYYVGAAAEKMVVSGEVKIICCPGVGSSSIASASMARQIAKAKNQYVAAITVGLGTASQMYESIQGYFIGRTNNMYGTTYLDLASNKIVELYERGARPTMLVGHSKGNMDIANALYIMEEKGESNLFKGVTFKTFGCGVFAPEGVKLVQYLGAMDSVGYLNTVNWVGIKYVPGRYHTLNSKDYPWTCMPISSYV